MVRRKRRRYKPGLPKEIVFAGEWLREYWLVSAIILMSVASVVAYYYWFVGTLSPFP